MARYISQVFIVVEAENVGDACDAMSACLSETLKFDGHIVDWSYADTPHHGFDQPKLLADQHQSLTDIEDEDFSAMNAEATREPIHA